MIVLALVVAVLVTYRFSMHQVPVLALTPAVQPGLPKLITLPPFALTERSGKTTTNRDLAGKIWVADFVYTTCPGPCPILTGNMAKLQDLVTHDPQVMLVSFSVDPVTDTPPVLAKYADVYHADPNRWWFLTGSEKQMVDIIFNGFHVEIQDNSGKPPEPGQFKVTHSTNFALVDGDGIVRAFYNGTDDADRDKLLHDIQELEKESR